MKVGDRVRIKELIWTDTDFTDLKVGDTGVITNISNVIIYVRLDRDFRHTECNWDSSTTSYEFFDYQLELIEFKKEYTLKITEDSDGIVSVSCENKGFTALELLGYLNWKSDDILSQIKGDIKPDVVTRKYIKEEK